MAEENEKTTGYVILTGVIEPEDEGGFTAVCPELGVASCGDTVEEALDMLGDALEVHLNALEEIGEVDRVFLERNIEIRRDTTDTGHVSVTIPTNKTVRAYSRAVQSAAAS